MKRISKKTLTLWRLRVLAVALPTGISAIILLKPYPAIQTAVLVLSAVVLSALIFIYLPLCYKNFFYTVKDNTLLIKKGVIYHSEIEIPRERIQYVSFVATPIERLLGLKTAVIFTAGSATLIGSLDKNDGI